MRTLTLVTEIINGLIVQNKYFHCIFALLKTFISKFIYFYKCYRITDDILAMARPSTSILVKKNVIQQFHRYVFPNLKKIILYIINDYHKSSWGIKSIINLQTPKEHASCGPPLEDSGYTYDPAIFMENESK